MLGRATAVGLIALFTATTQAGLGPSPDDLSRAYDAALAALRDGQDRRQIAARLRPAVEAHPRSLHHLRSSKLLADLAASPERAPRADAPPEQRLADTRVAYYWAVAIEQNARLRAEEVRRKPADPAVQLLTDGRAAIPRLIPLLGDQTPTRCPPPVVIVDNSEPPQPRVCDVALALVERLAGQQFHRDAAFARQLSELPPAERAKVAQRVAEWWAARPAGAGPN